MNITPKIFYVHKYLYLPVSNLIKTRQCAGDIFKVFNGQNTKIGRGGKVREGRVICI